MNYVASTDLGDMFQFFLVGFAQQFGREPDIAGKDDDLVVRCQRDCPVTDFMDAAIVHARNRVIKDHRRWRRQGSPLCEEITLGERLLFAFRQDLAGARSKPVRTTVSIIAGTTRQYRCRCQNARGCTQVRKYVIRTPGHTR